MEIKFFIFSVEAFQFSKLHATLREALIVTFEVKYSWHFRKNWFKISQAYFLWVNNQIKNIRFGRGLIYYQQVL